MRNLRTTILRVGACTALALGGVMAASTAASASDFNSAGHVSGANWNRHHDCDDWNWRDRDCRDRHRDRDCDRRRHHDRDRDRDHDWDRWFR
jgi:hypothetical protein